ncbi:MAG TPA: spermidine/putrescine ABC transporter substrate-binding protein [Planctomycetota bacterium]|nr:spermidine/putrescine ABC transporter substrate-binding protein [Planctomycetota bacterium]HRR80841.1 spermidine/putrescine ABC transporter substrate-binding protein [Planctomycetota bacterium]HRT95980.1 spermidine/putrescine ABC transporter substrate-binding protein [Planctomycetota bacterium]
MRRVAALALAALALGCSQAEKPKPQVTVYMYSEYIDPELPREFEAQTGIRVRLDVYEATEEMMAKLQQAGGASQYDVVVVSDHAIPVLTKLGLLQPLEAAKLPNAKNVSPQFANPPYDPGSKYSLPYQWGTMGLLYRKDKVPQAAELSWSLLLEPAKQPGLFVLIDSMRDMMAVALKMHGASVNSRKPDEVRAASDLILAAKRSTRCLGFEGGVGGKNKVADGTATLAVVYSGDALKACQENDQLAYGVPREGSIIWVDAMTIPVNAPNPDAAHQFINFILDAKVGARLSEFTCYATPNAASLPLLKQEDRENPAIYPPEETLKKLEYLEDLGDDSKLYDEIWTAVKAR